MRILCLRDHPLANWLDYSALFISAPVACAPQCVSTVPHQGLFLTSMLTICTGRGASRILHPQAPVPDFLTCCCRPHNPIHLTRVLERTYVVRLRVSNPPLRGRADSRGHCGQRNAGKIPRPIRKQRTPWFWMLRRCHRRDRSVLLFITIE